MEKLDCNCGWCITLFSDENQAENQNREHNDYLSWSPYDRISFSISNMFKDFIFPMQSQNANWCGVKQQLHLIPTATFNTTSDLLCEYNYKDWQICSDCDELIKHNGHDTMGLYCLITVRLSDKIVYLMSQMKDSQKANSLRSSIMKNIMQNLFNYSKENRINCECISFMSLGSEDFAMLILANNFNDFYNLVNLIKAQYFDDHENSKCNLIKSISTLTGFNSKNYNSESEVEAIVRLNVKHLQNIKPVIEILFSNFSKCSVEELFQGMGTIEAKISTNDFSHWKFNGIFNATSRFYKDNISSSRTYWLNDVKNVPDKKYTKIGLDEFRLEIKLLPKFMEGLDKKRKPSNNNDTSQSSIKNPVGKFIIEEYNRLICLTRCTEWVDILYEQRNAINSIVKYYEEGDNAKIYQDALNTLLEEIQNVLTHINQACNPITEIPYHNHYYSGSFSDILKMYYGIISSIIECGYSIPRTEDNKQSELRIGVKFESTNRIYTTLYSLPNHSERIAIFHLPYDALYDFNKTIVLLVHEVFHYIAPIDRCYRNQMMLKLWISYICDCLMKYYCDVIEDNKFLGETSKEWLDHINKYFFNNINKITEKTYEKVNITIKKFKHLESEDFCDFEYGFNFVKLIYHHSMAIIGFELIELLNSTDFQTKFGESFSTISIIINKSFDLEYEGGFYQWFAFKSKGFVPMAEYASSIKEAFCDLFMCEIFGLDFNEYLALFTEIGDGVIYKTENELPINYRVNLVSLCTTSDFPNWEKIKLDVSNDENVGVFLERLSNNSLAIKKMKNVWESLKSVLNMELEFWAEVNSKSNAYSQFIKCIEELRNAYSMLNKKTKETNGSSIKFDESIKLIIQFNYRALPNHEHLTDNTSSYKSQNAHIIRYSMHLLETDLFAVDSVSSLIELIGKLSTTYDYPFEDLWYRGVCSDTYSLLPSLFRNLDDSLSLYANQVNILKAAYSSTMNFPELWRDGVPEHLCCLQHYGMPTSLLDFSTNVLVALHFALNPDIQSDLEAIDNCRMIPIVYVFNPTEYSIAISILKEGFLKEDKKMYKNISPILYDVANDDLRDFFPGSTDADYLVRHSKDNNQNYAPCRRIDKYPVPVVIRRSNSRVLSQNGTFLAYNLNASPQKEKIGENQYSYLDLRRIQYDYTDYLIRNNLPDKRFLYEIRVNQASIGEMRKSLSTLRISKSKMYPELKYIFDEAKYKYRKRIGII